jgi:iron complex outermembrane receptor protein
VCSPPRQPAGARDPQDRRPFELRTAGCKLAEFARIDNIQDEEYVGSVIVNKANRRYYEPAPGRDYILGFSAGYSF